MMIELDCKAGKAAINPDLVSSVVSTEDNLCMVFMSGNETNPYIVTGDLSSVLNKISAGQSQATMGMGLKYLEGVKGELNELRAAIANLK